MTEHLPSWPTTQPTYGSVVLREFTDDDVHLAFELGEDPYIPLTGSLPALPTEQQALEWIHRQRGRFTEGKGHRGRGIASSALKALTAFAWTIPALHRSLYDHVVAVQTTLHISCRRLGK
ncbi:GNAT family N-acetyltransferase [Pseudarthrobacter sp. ATCC 49987]|uniref:GNAT family N-acetyltransferase n=1 Tax=Pseudarthrobacter sp. ATCC 49987 TaxID=2698204 RepID=UPI00136AAD85|nr:GNAT family N-acetyltransferase [Pseudarthrobacter sp. ATCC 49987]